MLDSQIRILYLAKYAPIGNINVKPDFHQIDGVAPIYHYEIYSILKKMGYQVTASRSIDQLYHSAKDFDYVFSLYNRMPFKNCEILVSSLCEYLKVPYLGSSPTVRSIAEDKNLTKIVASNSDVSTPEWVIVRSLDDLNRPPFFEGPYFVKPRFGASSEFIDDESLCENWTDVKRRSEVLLDLEIDVIVEKFMPGINLTLPIIFSDPPLLLPIISSTSSIKGNILSYKQKRLLESGVNRKLFSNDKVYNRAKDCAFRLYSALQSELDYARFDFRYDEIEDKISLLEFNICSNLGSHSTICQSANYHGISQPQLIEHILKFSLQRQNVVRQQL
jgi:D-alanine-D-alanine ligase